jgi:flagellar hook-length control protein FliK
MPAPNVVIGPVTSVSTSTNVSADNVPGSSATGDTGFAAVLGQQAAALAVTGDQPMQENGPGSETAEGGDLSALLPFLIGSTQSSGTAAAPNLMAAIEATDDAPASETDLAALLLALPGGLPPMPGYGMPDATGRHEAMLPSRTSGKVETATESVLANTASDLAVAGTDEFPETIAATMGRQHSRSTTADPPAIVAALSDRESDIRVESTAAKSVGMIAAGDRDPSVQTLATASLGAQAVEFRSPAIVKAIGTPVGASGWDGEIGGQIVWMTSHQQNRAELTLTPPQFGRIEISLSLSGDQANAFFVSANPAVRDALEAALPRLREVLADVGITLGQAQVGSESSSQRNSDGNPPPGQVTTVAKESLLTATAIGTNAGWLKTGRGLVDVFA